jgi:hypothetical protein
MAYALRFVNLGQGAGWTVSFPQEGRMQKAYWIAGAGVNDPEAVKIVIAEGGGAGW